MSDLGALSHHYQQSADLAKELNQAVMAVKKQFYHLAGEMPVPPQSLEHHRELLVRFIDKLVTDLSPSSPSPIVGEQPNELTIPLSIIERLRKAHKGTMAYYLDDLRATRQRLAQTTAVLAQQDIDLLDDVTATVGLDTAEVFRRMWRD